MSNPWIFDAERLDFTPSFKDGITKYEEAKYRIEGAHFIQRLAEELKLNYCTAATGSVFFHRFYMLNSFRAFPAYPMAATCLFLAGKVEETPKKCNDIVKILKSTLSEQNFAQFGPDPKEEIFSLERVLLQTLRFDLEVEHPYNHLVKYVQQSGLEVVRANMKGETINKDLLQSAWTFLNTSLCTTICLQYEPEIVAIAVILLACKTGGFEVTGWDNRRPEQKKWWDVYVENLDALALENICHQVLDVIQYSS